VQCLLLGFGRRSSHENEGKISDVVLTLACRIVEVEVKVEAVTLSTSGYASEGDFILLLFPCGVPNSADLFPVIAVCCNSRPLVSGSRYVHAP